MVTRKEYNDIAAITKKMFSDAGIVMTPAELADLEVGDLGLSDVYRIGLEIIVYVNTDRVCAKEMALLPYQTCPEHWHPEVNGQPGKEETFRCRAGVVYLYVDGAPKQGPILAKIHKGYEPYFTVTHEIVLHPGEQYTLLPNTKHWFQAGPEGAIISEFSTHSTDENDIFTDPHIARIPVVEA